MLVWKCSYKNVRFVKAPRYQSNGGPQPLREAQKQGFAIWPPTTNYNLQISLQQCDRGICFNDISLKTALHHKKYLPVFKLVNKHILFSKMKLYQYKEILNKH